jgi:hypothetical protein
MTTKFSLLYALFLFALLVLPVSAVTVDPFYAMNGVHKTNLANSVLASPKVAGMMLRDGWNWLEPTKGVRSYVYIDSQLARAATYGKHVSLGLYSGDGSKPAWGNDINSFTATVAALGARYGNDPRIDSVHMSAPLVTNFSMEMYLPPSWHGTTPEQIVIWEKAIDAFNKGFPNKPLILDIAMTPGTKTIAEYARTTLGTRFRAQVDNLKATTNLNASHILELKTLHGEGVPIGFEFVTSSIDQARFGGTWAQAYGIGESLGGSYYQFYQQDLQYVPNPTLVTAKSSGGFLAAPRAGRLFIGGVVPEPASMMLATIAAMALYSTRRSRCCGV